MKSRTLMIMAVGVAGAMTLASASSQAQTIRTYGDDDSGTTSGSQGYIPGAPVPQQQAQQRPATNGDEGGESSAPAGSHRISIHGTRSRSNDEQRREVLARTHTELYRGIIPGERDDLPHLSRAKADGARTDRPNPLTWVGFQPEETRTRIFFQSPRTMQYTLQESRENNDLVVIFDNANIAARNFSRFIDTSFFNRAIERIEAEETRNGNVRITLTMRENIRPSVSAEGQYLFIDFPHQAPEDDEDATVTR